MRVKHRRALTVERARRIAKGLAVPPASEATEREKRVETAIRRDVEANLALKCIERAGVPARFLIAWATMAAFSSPKNLPEADETAELREMRREVQSFQSLPCKAKQLATVVAKANALGWLNPSLAILNWQGDLRKLGKVERKQVADDFYYLPQILAWYASCTDYSLMRQRRFVRHLTRTTAKLQTELQRAVVQQVHQITGKYYFERVAAVLRVALDCAGEQKQASEMTGDALRMSYARSRRKS